MKYLDLLGREVKDCVTGFRGVVECVCYDLYGCIQVTLRPHVDEKGKMDESRWFDAKRIVQESGLSVMAAPVFEEDVVEAGPAEKPARE